MVYLRKSGEVNVVGAERVKESRVRRGWDGKDRGWELGQTAPSGPR